MEGSCSSASRARGMASAMRTSQVERASKRRLSRSAGGGEEEVPGADKTALKEDLLGHATYVSAAHAVVNGQQLSALLHYNRQQ